MDGLVEGHSVPWENQCIQMGFNAYDTCIIEAVFGPNCRLPETRRTFRAVKVLVWLDSFVIDFRFLVCERAAYGASNGGHDELVADPSSY